MRPGLVCFWTPPRDVIPVSSGMNIIDDIHGPTPPLTPRSATWWLRVIGGIGLIITGAVLFSTGRHDYYGPLAVGIGLWMLPWLVTNILATVFFLGFGAWLLTRGATIPGAVVIILGVIGASEQVGRIRQITRRGSGS